MTTRCPACGAPLGIKDIACKGCGAKVEVSGRDAKDANDLAQDRWSFTAQSPVPNELKPPAPKPERPVAQQPDAPSGVGYAGHRDVKQRYDMTVEMRPPPELRKDDNAPQNKPRKAPAQPTLVLHSLRQPSPPPDLQKPDQAVKSMNSSGVALIEPRQHQVLKEKEVRKTSGEANRLPLKGAPATARDLTGRARLGAQETKPLSIGLGLSAALLLASWMIPDTWSSTPLFSFQKISSASGVDLIALLARPIAGAVLLTVLVVPLKITARAIVGLTAGLVALALPLLLSDAPLPLRGSMIFLFTILCIVLAAICYPRAQGRLWGTILALLVPVSLLGIAVYGIATNELSPRQLAVFKEPLSIWASAIVSSQAAALLFQSRKN